MILPQKPHAQGLPALKCGHPSQKWVQMIFGTQIRFWQVQQFYAYHACHCSTEPRKREALAGRMVLREPLTLKSDVAALKLTLPYDPHFEGKTQLIARGPSSVGKLSRRAFALKAFQPREIAPVCFSSNIPKCLTRRIAVITGNHRVLSVFIDEVLDDAPILLNALIAIAHYCRSFAINIFEIVRAREKLWAHKPYVCTAPSSIKWQNLSHSNQVTATFRKTTLLRKERRS